MLCRGALVRGRAHNSGGGGGRETRRLSAFVSHVLPPWFAFLTVLALALVLRDRAGEWWWEEAVHGVAAGLVVWVVLHAWAGWFRPAACALVSAAAAGGALSLRDHRPAWFEPFDSPAAT